MTITARLKEELDVLKSALGDTGGDWGDEVLEALDMDINDFRVWMEDRGISGDMAKAGLIYAFAFIHGVAQERDRTVRELLDEEGLP